MSKFNDFVANYLLEQDDMGGGDMGGAPAPGPAPMDATPMGMGGQAQPPPAPKEPDANQLPMSSLAQILYLALRTNLNDLPRSDRDKIKSLTPRGAASIESDEDGTRYFSEINKIFDREEEEEDMVEPEVTPAEMR